MTEPRRFLRSTAGAVADSWCAFWFTPQPAFTLGLVRIGFGVVAVAWTLALLPDLSRVLGDDGAAPGYAPLDYQWSIFGIWSGATAMLVGWVVLLLSAVLLTVGWHSRLAAVAVFILMASFHRRAAYLLNAGDSILAVVALVLALSCCGLALSLDQRRRTGSFWTAEALAPWPIRLLQLQLSLIYLVSVQAKLTDRSWTEGSAAYYAWRTDGRWALLPPPGWVADNAVLVNAATWGTLVIELAIAVLVWNRRWRPWVLGAGVLMHLAMMVSMNVAFFSLAMFVLYLAFVPWETVRLMPETVKARWRVRRRRSDPSGEQQPVEQTPAA